MRHVGIVLVLGLATADSAFAAGPFYSNFGGLGEPGAVGLTTGPVAGNGTVAPAGFVWSEVANDSLVTANANVGYAGQRVSNPSNGGWRLADDFTVQPDELFDLDQISVFAYRTDAAAGSSPFSSANLRIWRGRPGDAESELVFGDVATNRLVATNDTNIYRIANTVVDPDGPGGPGVPDTRRLVRELVLAADVTLGPGHYWLDFQVVMPLTSQSGFFPTITIPGTRSLPGWNARQFTNGSTIPPAPPGWQDVTDAGTAATGQPPPPVVSQDLPFVLDGTYIPEPAAGLLLALAGLCMRRR